MTHHEYDFTLMWHNMAEDGVIEFCKSGRSSIHFSRQSIKQDLWDKFVSSVSLQLFSFFNFFVCFSCVFLNNCLLVYIVFLFLNNCLLVYIVFLLPYGVILCMYTVSKNIPDILAVTLESIIRFSLCLAYMLPRK